MKINITWIIFVFLVLLIGLIQIRHTNVSAQTIPPQAKGQTGTLTGKVFVSGDTPPGTKVVINGTYLSAYTDNEGTYTIPGVPINQYFVVSAYRIGEEPDYPVGSGRTGPEGSAVGVYIPTVGATVTRDLFIDYTWLGGQ